VTFKTGLVAYALVSRLHCIYKLYYYSTLRLTIRCILNMIRMIEARI